MIAYVHRFHGRASIQRLYGGGKAVRTNHLSLKYAPNSKRRHYRVAVVVSRKVSKSAVVRNRIRRRIYENVRILFTNFNEAYDLVLTAYDEKIATISPAELTAEVTKLITKAHLTSVDPPNRDIVEPKKS